MTKGAKVATTYLLNAPDHRPGAMGDWREYRAVSYRGALAMARELNAGIFVVTLPSGVRVDVEFNGSSFRTLERETVSINQPTNQPEGPNLMDTFATILPTVTAAIVFTIVTGSVVLLAVDVVTNWPY